MTLGLVGDEASAAATSALTDRPYGDELARFRANEEGMTGFGRVSADLAGAAIPAATGIGALGSFTSLPARMAAGAGMGGGMGLVQGFMEGEGGFGNRATSGAIGLGLGGILGGALPLAAEVGRSVVAAGSNALRNRAIGGQLSDALNVSPETARVAAGMIGADDQAAIADALRAAGPDAMLADASGRTVGALDTVLQSPVPGADVARRRVTDRAGAAFNDVMDAIDPRMGPKLPPQAAMTAIRKGTAGARNEAYNAAYAAPIDYSTEQGGKLLSLQSRLPGKAIGYANELMKLKGEESAQIMASIADDGAVTFTRPPDVRQWDYIKQALDQLAESGDGAGALGGQTRMGAAYQSLAKTVRDTVADLVPEYRTALDTASDAITRREAVKFGTAILDAKTTTEEALEQIADATAPQIEAMRDGMRGQLAEAFGNINAVPSDRNVDARQAAAALRKFTSPNAQTKMAALFGDEWPGILEQINRAGAALGLRADVSTNSRTAGRMFTKEAIQGEVTPGAIQQGKPVKAVQDFIGGMTGASPEAIARANARVQSELADLLTRQGGAPQAAVSAIAKALAENPQNMAAGSGTALAVALGGATGLPALLAALRGPRP